MSNTAYVDSKTKLARQISGQNSLTSGRVNNKVMIDKKSYKGLAAFSNPKRMPHMGDKQRRKALKRAQAQTAKAQLA